MNEGSELGQDGEWQAQSVAAVRQFGETLKNLHQNNPWPDLPLLPRAIDHLMTELWDQGFSQTEIKEAFEDAVLDMPRYAAGDEVRP